MYHSSGVRSRGESVEGQVWNILGQIYLPKHITETTFSWNVTFPPGGFVPLHFHEAQDEFVFLLEGRLDVVINGQHIEARPGDLVFLPMRVPHSVHNRSDADVKCLSWVSPARKLYEYFQRIHMMQDSAEMERLAPLYEVKFV